MPARHTVYTISPSPDSTIAIEIAQTGLSKGKHLFVFEKFKGTLIYSPDLPLETELTLSLDADSLICRDSFAKPRRRERLARYAKLRALAVQNHPTLEVRSERFTAKPLRGFIAHGVLCFRGAEQPIKANIGFGVQKNGRLQVDADATIRLSDLAIPLPSAWFGLVRTEDQAVLHALLWGAASSSRAQPPAAI